jgi:microcystin-dependent protein
MGTPFLGEIRIVGFNFAPRGWAMCDGQVLPINQNPALFSILGTMYGGNGQTTFALPDFRGRVPVHTGNGIQIGQRAGEEAHVLTINEAPAHSHTLAASSLPASLGDPAGRYFAATDNCFAPTPNTAMRSDTLTPFGGSQPHLNMQPFLVLHFVIALQGVFPSRN